MAAVLLLSTTPWSRCEKWAVLRRRDTVFHINGKDSTFLPSNGLDTKTTMTPPPSSTVSKVASYYM